MNMELDSDVKEALKAFMKAKPPTGGHLANGPGGLARFIAGRWLGDKGRWKELSESVREHIRTGEIVSRSRGHTNAYWPRRSDRQPVTT